MSGEVQGPGGLEASRTRGGEPQTKDGALVLLRAASHPFYGRVKGAFRSLLSLLGSGRA